jgi:ribosomal protein L36
LSLFIIYYLNMKVKASIKRLCGYCQIIRRGKTLYVRCQKYGKHKQRQGFHTQDQTFVIGDKNYCECPEYSQLNLVFKQSECGTCCEDCINSNIADKFDLFENHLI